MQNAYFTCTFLARVNILFYTICIIFFHSHFIAGLYPKNVTANARAQLFEQMKPPYLQDLSHRQNNIHPPPRRHFALVQEMCIVQSAEWMGRCMIIHVYLLASELFCLFRVVFGRLVFFRNFCLFFMYISSWSFVYLLINVYIIIFNSFKLLKIVKIHCFFKYIYEDDALWNNRIEQSARVHYRKNFLGRYR